MQLYGINTQRDFSSSKSLKVIVNNSSVTITEAIRRGPERKDPHDVEQI